eukprot:239921-Prorocentrum_minimum.AAC.1
MDILDIGKNKKVEKIGPPPVTSPVNSTVNIRVEPYRQLYRQHPRRALPSGSMLGKWKRRWRGHRAFMTMEFTAARAPRK